MKPTTKSSSFLLYGGILLLLLLVVATTTTGVYAQIPTTTTTPTTPTMPPTNQTTLETATNATTTTTTNATTTTTNNTIITALIWNPGDEPDTTSGVAIGGERVEQLSPANIQYQQTDPAFAKLAQVTADCLNHMNGMTDKMQADAEGYVTGAAGSTYGEDIQRQDLCTDVINQGVAQFCESTDFATFDIQKCEEARTMTDTYVGVAESLYG